MLVTIINKLDETNKKVDDMNSNLTSRLDMALNERKDIDMLKDKQDNNEYELSEMKDRMKELYTL